METTPLRGYRTKTIRKILRKKLAAWMETIPDDLSIQLADHTQWTKAQIQSDLIVTGGSIASMLMGEQVQDFDVYLASRNSAEALAHYYVEQFVKDRPDLEMKVEVKIDGQRVLIALDGGAAGEGEDENETIEDPEPKKPEKKDSEKKPYRARFLSENAISLSDKLQIVIRFWGQPEDIHHNYDFAHCTCWYRPADGEIAEQLGTPKRALLSMMSRTLQYQGSLYPVCSLFRLRKFVDRGWRINAGEILKIALQVSQLDLTDRDVLREQLVGVDMLYFWRLLERLGDSSDPVDTETLVDLITEVFDD